MKKRLIARIRFNQLDVDATSLPLGFSWTHLVDIGHSGSTRIHTLWVWSEAAPKYFEATDLTLSEHKPNAQSSKVMYVHDGVIVSMILVFDTLGSSEKALLARTDAQALVRRFKRMYRQQRQI